MSTPPSLFANTSFTCKELEVLKGLVRLNNIELVKVYETRIQANA